MKHLIASVMILMAVWATVLVGKSNAELPDLYVMTPMYHDIKPGEIKTARTSYYYTDIDDLKVLADLTNDHGYGLPTQDFFNKIIKGGKVLPVEPGNAPVIFLYEYDGWWIFKIDR